MKKHKLRRYLQKKYILCYMLCGILIFLLCEPACAAERARFGLLLWADRLLPSLLPFLILCQILLRSGCLDALSKRLHLPLSYFVLFSGTLFGFPMGAKLSADLYAAGKLSHREATLLCVLANQISPAFVGGYLLSETLQLPQLARCTYLILYAPALCAGVAFLSMQMRDWTDGCVTKKSTSELRLNLAVLDAGIMDSFETMLKLGGYVMLFSVLGGMCGQLLSHAPAVHTLIMASLEITGGISVLNTAITDKKLRYIAMLAATAFGGCSGIAQTASLIRDKRLPKPLSLRCYVCGRLLLATVTALLAALCSRKLPL